MTGRLIYLLATPERSYEGIEGILGYTPYEAYPSLKEAELAAVKELQVRMNRNGLEGLEYEWRVTPDESAKEILYYSYLESKPNTIVRHHSGIMTIQDNVRIREKEECAVIEVFMPNIVDFCIG